jgi:hypothetical protein
MKDHGYNEEEPLPPFKLTGWEEIDRLTFDQKKQQRLEHHLPTTTEGGVASREGRPLPSASKETMLLISSPECNHKNISRKSTLGVDIAELGK